MGQSLRTLPFGTTASLGHKPPGGEPHDPGGGDGAGDLPRGDGDSIGERTGFLQPKRRGRPDGNLPGVHPKSVQQIIITSLLKINFYSVPFRHKHVFFFCLEPQPTEVLSTWKHNETY